jgi:glycosyltransferase involved in cell wall biosynthesis
MQNLLGVAKKVNGKVDFLGQIDPSKMQSIYSRSQIFVLNSSYEGLPHVLIEARMAGVMTIAKAGTGSDEVITSGLDGLLVGDKEILSLKAALAWARSHPDGCLEFTRNATADLKNRFDQDNNFQQILNILTHESAHDS